ncbi:unnamed protein product [Didymodactylos carnosus]|uniref:CCHC-type domain-containing protein n=1 Tax=Didymodactylos carnosus TaxID=1234261 RepID=A0A815ILR1_9BILA|nr:unnamed protein product [Didymodactylos carnosus]CAF4251062.1 unnamed protein product [Didymodactylos carnosus]
MNTRTTLNLTNTPISALQLTPKRRNQQQTITKSQHQRRFTLVPSIQQQIFLLPSQSTSTLSETSSTSSHSPSPSITQINLQNNSTMIDNNDILELEEMRTKQIEIENKFLSKIPNFISPEDTNITDFISTAENIFDKLNYSDDTRVHKIGDKLDETLQQWYKHFTKTSKPTWNNFKEQLPTCCEINTNENQQQQSNDSDEEFTSLLDLIRPQVHPFTGEEDATHWFTQIDSKLYELNLTFQDRIAIIPYLLKGNAIIWYSLNKARINCYIDFCQLFAEEYINKQQSSSCDKPKLNRTTNSVIIKKSAVGLAGMPTIAEMSASSHATRCGVVAGPSSLSPVISKALLDKFVKDPIKFNGGKDNVHTWLEEIEQQFKIMKLDNSDKLNLIHICLKGEAQQWYKQHKDQIDTWPIFINDLIKAFTSNFKRDLAFQKLKQYHQTVNQSVIQYYAEMMKVIKQADPDMNESTKVQYLMNGLRPSLSIETRRNYPTTTQEFLQQAQKAEELTAISTITTSDLVTTDDLSTASSLLHHQPKYWSSRGRPNRSNGSFSAQQYQSSDQPRYIPSTRNIQQQPSSTISSSINNNNQRLRPCFNCGATNHLARDCRRFGQQNQ